MKMNNEGTKQIYWWMLLKWTAYSAICVIQEITNGNERFQLSQIYYCVCGMITVFVASFKMHQFKIYLQNTL